MTVHKARVVPMELLDLDEAQENDHDGIERDTEDVHHTHLCKEAGREGGREAGVGGSVIMKTRHEKIHI